MNNSLIALLNYDHKVIPKIRKLNLRTSAPGLDWVYPRVVLVWKCSKKDLQVVFLSLDAQGAFDQLEWPYALETLKQFGFRTNDMLGEDNIFKPLIMHS